MTNSQDAIAAFLAKGGKVTKAREGAGLGLTNRAWFKASRDQEVSRVVEDFSAGDDYSKDAFLGDALAEREAEIGAQFGLDGLNDFRAGLAKHGAKAMLGWED